MTEIKIQEFILGNPYYVERIDICPKCKYRNVFKVIFKPKENKCKIRCWNCSHIWETDI